MAVSAEQFLDHLDAQIQEKHLLHHDFYRAWTKGELTIDCLREYAKDYYHHVQAFPTYLSALHSRVEDIATRRAILQNLIEEEAGCPNHPELWKQFALRLGVRESELMEHVPSKEITALIDRFREICSKGNLAEAVGALYSYESQIPAVCVSKIEGLKKYYGKSDPKDWEYFTVHIAADQVHAAQERALLKKHLQEENFRGVFSAVNDVLDGLQNFLSGLCQRFQICQCH